MQWDDDLRLVAEMAVCEHYRIRHSEFLRWGEEDRAKAIWFRSRQLATCPSCGIRPEEADAYVTETRVFPCCQKRERAEEDLAKMPTLQRGRGARIVLVKPEETA